MGTTYVERYNKMHLFKKGTATHQKTAKQDILAMFRHLKAILDYDQQFIDPHFQADPFWSDYLYDPEKFELKHNFNKPTGLIEDDDIFTDSHLSDKLRYAVIDS